MHSYNPASRVPVSSGDRCGRGVAPRPCRPRRAQCDASLPTPFIVGISAVVFTARKNAVVSKRRAWRAERGHDKLRNLQYEHMLRG